MSELLKINVNEHTEQKNGLTYLSWAWAWAEVLKVDPQATWVAHEFGPDGCQVPMMVLPDTTAMVKVGVTIKGNYKQCLLPVMDHRNKAIPAPNAFQVNTAIMRCLAKAISMHGLGLYIYAGEDLPEIDVQPAPKLKMAALDGIGDDLPQEAKEALKDLAAEATELVNQGQPEAALNTIKAFGAEGDERLYLDRQLPSNVRSALRKVSQQKAA